MKLRKLILAATCIFSVQGLAFAQTLSPAGPEPVDSVTETVASFLALNLRQGIEGAVEQLQSYGLTVNRQLLDSLLIENLRKPYSSADHLLASQKVSALMAENAARKNEKMLAQAAARPAATTLPSGVIIETLTAGSGAAPTAESYVTMRYKGTLPDGTVFDEMTPDTEPMRARVSDLAPGLIEAFPNMRPGGTYVVTIPAPLAYGSEGVPGVIPPDSALEFSIEFIATE